MIVKVSGGNESKVSFFSEALATNLSQFCCCSVAESCLTLRPHALHHNRLSVSWSLLSIMCVELVMLSNHLILSTLFSFCLQSFPALGSIPMSQFFTSGGQNIGASASAAVLLKNIQGWFPLGLTGLISLLSRDSQESSPAP